MKKIITCTGYGTTGSSVVSDLLKEFNNIHSFGNYEYRFLFDPNGVRELEVALKNLNNRQNSDYYIKNFLKFIKFLSKSSMSKYYEKTFNNSFYEEAEKFIRRLIDVEWDGYWHRDIMNEGNFRKMFYYLERFFQKKILKLTDSSSKFYRKKMFYSSFNEERFIREVKMFLKNLFNKINTDKNILIFDQLLPPEDTRNFSKYFEDIKIIIVDRDPRDLYFIEKYKYKEKFGPYNNVDSFIRWYKLIRKTQQEEIKNKNVLLVNFEDFIYKYEETCNKIFNFIGVQKKNWIYPQKYFIPSISIKNTKIWYQYQIDTYELKKIEEELDEYLYKF